jgi:hypothetical protein
VQGRQKGVNIVEFSESNHGNIITHNEDDCNAAVGLLFFIAKAVQQLAPVVQEVAKQVAPVVQEVVKQVTPVAQAVLEVEKQGAHVIREAFQRLTPSIMSAREIMQNRLLLNKKMRDHTRNLQSMLFIRSSPRAKR